jgi:ABC-type Fe3+ transport system substrate-binding protein
MMTLRLLTLLACLALGIPIARAADWDAGAGPDWQPTLAAARGEGNVVIAGQPELAKPLADAFRRDTGLGLEHIAGEPRDVISRVAREMRAHSLSVDLFFTGSTTLPLIRQGLMEPIKPQLMLPNVTDPANWIDGRLKWIDNAGQYLLIPSEYVHGWPLFNSDKVKPGEITRWQDMLKPQYKGKIAAYDPRSGGPGQAVASFLAETLGIDFVKRLYVGQEATLAGNSRQLVEWVARGTYPIALAALPTDIERFRRNGFNNLVVGDMADGPGTLLGGSSLLAEPKGAPHPKAATIFLNWYYSHQGQEIFSTVWETPSRRRDVRVPSVPPYTIPKPGVAYIDQYREDWYENVRPKVQKAITDALGGQ